ncbi:short-chain dehydrogenase/reductase SDR [Rubrobacter xylanophilus DSM 9941]|uniref:Short-chain dehydrogenase/reductase SDR n=1 Tax=Rubrobacter xylanophilus (strain DSM 9941 / JCM 11954 / NBRC 16129 / PRD-1) TaxID=266117 RepID=Q1AZW7_RUBXD|nr:SDR family oxidoreductase [Rubrobacter xylanophilus]ABG03061.1 short-chain dehydrogenase/reductase SDR [Rubrobacter xylanophilus DSM 9941]
MRRPGGGLEEMFSLDGRVAVVTGGTGVLGGAVAAGLARAGARVGVLGRRRGRAEEVAAGLGAEGAEALALRADVLDEGQLRRAREELLGRWGRLDILVNAAGGNVPGAVLGSGEDVFRGLRVGAFREALDLNLLGTVLPSLVFGEAMASGGRAEGCIVNVSSMAALRPLTRVAGYSAAKAAVENFTRWLAVELSRRYGPGMRVNAVAPGFFLGEQNRGLLIGEDGNLTPRGRAVIEHTPMGRFGKPEELAGAVVWLCGPGASFVTGAVVPVDGGFSAFGGV